MSNVIQGNVIKVGMADLNIACVPDQLKTIGLGSCVGIVLYDPMQKIGGMAHVMLPTSELSREKDFNPAKYADTAIPLLIQKMSAKGAHVNRMKAKLAGGAQMFSFHQSSEAMRIGPRNVKACEQMLGSLNIQILAAETGGSHGRTIGFNVQTGILSIRTVNQGIKEV